MEKITILGSGTWGTAIANMLATQNIEVTLFSHFKEECDLLKATKKHPHLECRLSENIHFTDDIIEACDNTDVVFFATPSLYLRNTANLAKPYLKKDAILVTLAKGIEPETHYFMSDILADVLGNEFKIVALSGPTHAEEVSICLPTLIVSASENDAAARQIQEICSNETLRVYTNNDIRGVELCGALKNIVALAAGMSEGLGYGDNAKAAIVTRGLAEITRLGLAMGCNKDTFAGLAGIGDIVVTATSNHSRNHNAGVLFGKGYSLEETLEKVGMVVEGVNALKAAKQLSKKYQVELPLIDAVYTVVYGNIPAKEVVPLLFGRKPKSE